MLFIEGKELNTKGHRCHPDHHIDQSSVMTQVILCEDIKGLLTVFSFKPDSFVEG